MAITIAGDVTWDQAAYDKLTRYALRPQLYFDRFADVKPTNQSMAGSSVIFNLTSDLAVASTALDESTDVTPVSMADSQVTVTLAEYGAAVRTTAFLRGTSYIPVDPVVANVVGFNAGVSIDTVARDVMKGGSNVIYASGGTTTPSSRATVTPLDTLAAHDVRLVAARLEAANVANFGGYYAAVIHPHVALDLREETGAASWRDPHTYSQPTEIWNGELGEFESFRFVKTSQAPIFEDAGSSTTNTDVYRTLFFGREALAKAFSTTDGNGSMPRIVPGPVTDLLRRFVPMGWHWLGGSNACPPKTASNQWGTLRWEPSPSRPCGRAGAETERCGARKRDATVRTYGNPNRKSHAEMTWPRIQRVTNRRSVPHRVPVGRGVGFDGR